MAAAAAPAGRVHDVLGIGFGPSGLALAVAIDDLAPGLDVRFLEQKLRFSWHEGMLLPDARMQVSCLKDLATLRDPCSRFSFLNYLHQQGRLDEFVNLSTFRPTRLEFDDYLRWAAGRVGAEVLYGREVLAVSPITVSPITEPPGDVTGLRLEVRDAESGAIEEHLAREVVLCAGARPRLPPGILAGERIFHSDRFLQAIDGRFSDPAAAWRFVVVGDGQSGAEVFDYLASRYPNASVVAAVRGFGYRPMDETPFVNEIFFPSSVDLVHGLEEPKRTALLGSLRNTNYAVVDEELIERIYRRLYDARVAGRRSLEVRRLLELRSAVDLGDRVAIELADWRDGRPVRLEADALVLATGYTIPNPHPLLAGLAPHLVFDDSGRYSTGRGYRVETQNGCTAGVFLQGYCEDSHGIGDTLLSVAAPRAGEIVAALQSRKVQRSQEAEPAAPGRLLHCEKG